MFYLLCKVLHSKGTFSPDKVILCNFLWVKHCKSKICTFSKNKFNFYPNKKSANLPGKAGSGKSSAVVKLTLDWAKRDSTIDQLDTEDINQSEKLLQPVPQAERLQKRFDFVFLIPLKDVDRDITLEQTIIQENDLKDENLTEDQIKRVLNSPRSLLIFDGYDEYKKGTNSAIDAAIGGEMGNAFIIVTSRPDHMDKKDKNKLHGEIQNNGLGMSSIKKCTQRYLEDTQKADGFLKEVTSHGVVGLLRIPILLLMMCLLHIQNNTLPKNRTKIVRGVIDMYIMRARERGVDLEDTDQMLLTLGELCYGASQRDTNKLLIRKVSALLL